MNAVFRKNLTEALAINANDEDTVLDTGGAFYGCHRHRAVSPGLASAHSSAFLF